MAKAVAVVMAGGSGTRFFPLSRKALPKQYLPLFSEKSLLKETIDRVEPLVGKGNVFLCSAASQSLLAKEHAGPGVGFFFEPEAKNTAPCLMWAVLGLLESGHAESEVMVALPADHFVRDGEKFRTSLALAIDLAQRENILVTLGITPSSPHTGYGYIEGKEKWGSTPFLKVAGFIEKPELARAQVFFKQKTYFWNAGIFVGTLQSFRAAFERHLQSSWNNLTTAKGPARDAVYLSLKAESIDTAVMEKETSLVVLPVGDIGWSDVGSWSALADLLTGGDSISNHALNGGVESVDSQGCFVSSQKKVALLGVRNLIVVDTEDCLLIASRSHDQQVREIAKILDS